MADVEVQMQFTTTEKKTRRVKKTSKRRESSDGERIESEVTISELGNNYNNDQGYVLAVLVTGPTAPRREGWQDRSWARRGRAGPGRTSLQGPTAPRASSRRSLNDGSC